MHKLTPEEMGRVTVEDYRACEKLPVVVVLDNIRSMNNIGSFFRTADAFRISKLCLCGITATPPHRDIHKTALGAELSVTWEYFEQTTDCLDALNAQGYEVYAVELAHDSIPLQQWHPQFSAEKPIAIVLGNEIDGVGEDAIDRCKACIEIPQEGTKHSLNVSCTAAIAMWHLFSLVLQKN